jgi:L-seryl-tRNA(Ser) seleniumtransferase
VTDPRRGLPSVGRLLELPEVVELLRSAPRNLVVAAIRRAVADARARGSGPGEIDWGAQISDLLSTRLAPSLQPLLNATGVVLHTNLGRAPLAEAAVEAAAQIGRGYSNLELDQATGARGSRLDHCSALLAERAGAEDGLVVNNAAGALVLALNATAEGREVLISRGELVEIGGSFRIPDIIAKSGAVLREVGTTNRTHLTDYQAALTERTAAILVVHRSNFEMTGFVTSPPLAELAALAAGRGLPLIHDVGSGLLLDLADYGLNGEPIVPAAAAVADLAIFSGDKLLGGPQAGCVVGRARSIAPLRRNPFARAVRADKLTLAALEATLGLYRDRARAIAEIPVLRMITAAPATLAERADRLMKWLPAGADVRLEPADSAVGGGSFPGARLPTTTVSVGAGSVGPHGLAVRLRLGTPAIMVRIEAGRVVLDPRTLTDAEIDLAGPALGRALAAE